MPYFEVDLESANGETTPRRVHGPSLKWLTAYKMQLFLYAKASGATELKTSNLWRGVDPKPAA